MITIHNRNGQPRYIEVLDSNNYLIWGESAYIRFSNEFVDFEGGPFIKKGHPLYKGDNREVIDIKSYVDDSKPNCCKITVV